MMSNPKVSVIIPCYNQGEFLEEAVNSVLNQTFQDFEIIIVNDGSTDKFTNKLLENYEKPKTQVFRTKNSGLPATRNFAIEKSKGKYILPLDSDDKIEATYLEKAVKILDSNKKVGFVTPWIQCFEEDQTLWQTKPIDLKVALTENTTAVASVFRKECWEKVGGYDTKMIGYQDWDFWISIRKLGYLDAVIEEPLFFYRIRKGSMLSSSNKKRVALVNYLLEKHRDIVEKYFTEIIIRQEENLIYHRELDKQTREEKEKYLSDAKKYEEAVKYYQEREKNITKEIQKNVDGVATLQAELEIATEQLKQLKFKQKQQKLEKDQEIAELNAKIIAHNEEISELRRLHKQVKSQLTRKERIIQLNNEEITKLKARIAEQDYHIDVQEIQRREREALIAELQDIATLKNFKPLRLRNTFLYEKFSLKKWLKITYLSAGIITPEFIRARVRPYAIRMKEWYKNRSIAKSEIEITQKKWSETKPLVSVVIPCFNYGKYVEEAIDSVLAQSFQDFEIIVVEGGSTDGITPAILRKLKKPKTRILFRSEPHLAGDNRNFGLKHARGKYICCIDADDKIRPTYLEKALFYLENYNYDIVSPSLQKFGDSDEVYHVPAKPTLEFVLDNNGLTTVALYKKTFWEKAKGYHDFGRGKDHIHEDWDLWVRILAHGARVFNILEPLLLYRSHGVSLSNAHEKSYADHAREIKKFNAHLLTQKRFEQATHNNSIKYRVSNPNLNLRNSFARVDNKKRVLFALPFTVLGGMDKRVSQIAEYLSQNNVTPAIFTTIHFDDVIDGSTSAVYEKITSEVYHLPRFIADEQERKDFIFYYLETRRVECLVVVGSEFFYHLLPEIKEKYPHIRVVDLQFNTVGHFENNRRYAHLIDYTVAENQEVKSKLLDECGESPKKVVQILSGIDTHSYSKEIKRPLTIQELPKNKKIVLYLGRLSEEKGPDIFIKIAAKLKNNPSLFFVLAGTGVLIDECKDMIKKLGIEKNIFMPGMVNSLDYLPYTDILILPSRIDGRPYTILEALSMSIPVIASNVGGLPDIIKHNENGILCKSENIEEFAKSVEKLVNNEDFYKKISKNAREYAIENFDMSIENSSYMKLFLD